MSIAAMGNRKGIKHSHNEDYFNEPLEENRAYWLGFIMADGCVKTPPKRSPVLAIKLAAKDKGHLEKFRTAIKATNPLYFCQATNGYSLEISSLKLSKGLAKFNVTPRKSLTANMPSNIPHNLLRHFYRGYFDGDGCLCFSKTRKQWITSMLGTKSFLEDFRLFISKKTSIPFTKIGKTGKNKLISVVRCGGNKQVPKIVSILYDKANIYLDRKMAKYQEMKQCVQSVGHKRLLTIL